MDLRESEKRNKRIGFMTSLGIHSAVLIALIFLTGWKEPYPAPGASYGIELNFGLDNQGSGDVQPLTPVGTEDEQAAVTETLPDQKTEEAKPEVKEEAKEEKTAEQLTSNDNESPALVKEEVKKETKKEPIKEVVKERPTETPKVIAAYKKEEKKQTPVEGGKKGTAGNQGDDKDKVGDKGNPEGKLDAKALYGTPGGGGNGGNGNGGGGNGFGLTMGGWKWTIDPKVPDLPDNENGKIVFDIECDENGDITDIKTIERSLSPSAERMLKEEILKNSLIRTAGEKAPPRSRGRITFILKTN